LRLFVWNPELNSGEDITAQLLTCDAQHALKQAIDKHPDIKKLALKLVQESTDKKLDIMFNDLRAEFKSGTTKPVTYRKRQLMNLLRMLRDGRQVLSEAIQKDLHRDATSALYLELNQLESAAQHAIDYVSDWVQPDKVGTNLVNLPGSSSIVHEPYGTALIFGCWNYPYKLAIEPLIGAIAAGNSVLLKMPTDMVPNCSEAIIRLCGQYLDTKTIKVIGGGVKVNKGLSKMNWDVVFYTGSARVGKVIYEEAAKQLTPVCLEMGGKCPAVIFPSSNLYIAAKRIAWAKWVNAGQTCVSVDHVFVHEDVAEEFLTHIQQCVRDMYGEDPQSSEYFCRMVNGRHFERVKSMIDDSKSSIRFGGKTDSGSLYIEPTVLYFNDDTQNFKDSKAMSEEIFGPILPVVTFRDYKQVISSINAGEKPLSMYIFTNEETQKKEFLHKTSSGACIINEVFTYLSINQLPFGGVGHSGLGKYHGKHSFHTFSHNKAVLQRPDTTILDAPIKYPPYVPWKVSALAMIMGVRSRRQINIVKSLLLLVALLGVFQNRQKVAKFLHLLVSLVFGY